jgi:hypothetical protein
VWWHTPVNSAFRRQRQEDCEFEVNPGYIKRLSQKEKDGLLYSYEWTNVATGLLP